MRRRLAVACLGAGLAAAAGAQISPGELSRPHAELEGSGQCLACHDQKQGVAADLCLACHAPLAWRIAAGRGLHARPEYERCVGCHIEHHGRDFELVWWGRGRAAEDLDHGLTGHALVGAHARLECRDCHRAERIRDPRLRPAGVDFERTFLGLGRECLACHRDEHRGQLAAADCLGCHDQERFRPAPSFDHGSTSYPLTGRHRNAACERCHPRVEDAAALYVRYTGVATACASCHDDPHRGRLGGRCASCHATAGWQRVERRSFDHDRTRFALAGRHRQVACDDCHRGGLLASVAGFQRCAGCHADPHGGQLAQRADGGDCASCHEVEGFSPAHYGLEEHEQSSYPLAGAHLAVACSGCHVPVTAAELGTALPAGRLSTPRLRFADLSCLGCHEDPHAGDAARQSAEKGCLTCHTIDSWRGVAFDHALTGTALDEGHRRADCFDCHAAGELRFAGVARECAGCHQDPHRGQLSQRGEAVACARCHASQQWRPALFDHDRDSRYRLEGAHRALACGACHPREADGRGSFVRYRPLGSACGDCHGRDPESRAAR